MTSPNDNFPQNSLPEVGFPSEQSQFFKAFFKQSPIGLNLCRMDGHWVESNPAFLKIIGYSAEEADNDNLTYWQLTPEKYAEDELVQLESLKSRKVYGPYEKEFIRKDGSLVPVRLNGFIISKDGEDYIWSMIEDLSAEKSLKLQLEKTSNFFEATLANLPVAVFAKDSQDDWRFIIWNKQSENVFGLHQSAVLGKTDYDLFPKEQADFFEKDTETLASLQTVRIEEEPVTPTGKQTLWLRTYKLALADADGTPRYLLGITQDITDERNAAIELKDSNTRLRDAIDVANKALHARSTFLSNVSHEIRTPLNSIIGFADLLLSTDPTEQQNEYLRILNHGAHRLLEIVNDILDMQKIESGLLKPSFEWENPADVILAPLDLLKSTAKKKAIHFDYEIEMPSKSQIKVDRKFIDQILTNLVGNAIKFTPTGGTVQILATVKSKENTLKIVVKDSGIGIAADKREHIFEPFEQLDTSTRKTYGGTGLGLAIVKGLVQELSGTIELASEEGQGTTFEVQIPVEVRPIR